MDKSKSSIASKQSLIAGTFITISVATTSCLAAIEAPGTVIHDNKTTAFPISHWMSDDMLEGIQNQLTADEMIAATKLLVENNKVTPDSVPQVFPIDPQYIKPVTLPGTQIKKSLPNLPQPMFIIGNDPYSIRWFEANKSVLVQYRAMGILTRATNQTEWEVLRRKVAPLQLVPMNADVLSDQLGAPGYPVMITRGGFFQ